MTKTSIWIVVAGALAVSAASAGNLRYEPSNPSFGGNPNLSSYLIGTAQIQNQFIADSGDSGGVPDISFPPIVIDLGGLGDDEEEVPTDDTPAAAATQSLMRLP